MTKFLTLTYPGILLLSFCLIPQAIAQIIPDNTLSTTVDSADGVNFTIENGDRAGNNLFHSFQEFSVPNNGSATFNNAIEVENIFSRVTGGNISEIQGAINANGSANLLLINPAGIVFGENASLNIGGSFLATTADSLLFEGGEFSAIDPQAAPLLTINRPIGLNFGDNPGNIVNRSGEVTNAIDLPTGLKVLSEKTLALVGGEIILDDGHLTTPGGNVKLGSVAESTIVALNMEGSDYQLDYTNTDRFGDIRLDNLARIDVSAAGGGEVHIQGRNIILTNGGRIFSTTLGELPGGNITISATESIQVLGVTDRPNLFEPGDRLLGVSIPLRSSITAKTFGAGNAGSIALETRQLTVTDGARVAASSELSVLGGETGGTGGDITINAENIRIAGVFEVREEGIDLFGIGRFGIEISGATAITTVTDNSASAGNITIDTNNITLADGGIISTNTFADGAGGNLVVNATESIDIFGRSPSGVVYSVIASSSATGVAGDISIQTEQLNLQNGGRINVRSFNNGRAGNLTIDTENLLLSEGVLDAATQAGDRGNINVIDADTIFLRNGSSITTSATELSTGGDIKLNSGAIAIDNSSNITAIAEAGRGGNIQINSQALFREPNAQITAASNLGIDGTITFNTPDVDPTSGIVELPSVPIDAEAILAQDLCKVEQENIAGGSSFIVTGRGGLTPTSAESLDNRDRVVGWADESAIEVSNSGAIAVISERQASQIQQAQGLTVANGSLWLTANSTDGVPQSTANHPDCNS